MAEEDHIIVNIKIKPHLSLQISSTYIDYVLLGIF